MIRSANPEVVQPYLKDASNLIGGYAREVVFPEDEKEVVLALDEACRTKTPVTVAGNGTGLVGARIPFGGIVLSTEKLGGLREIHQIEGNSSYAVTGPALTLKQLQEAVSAKGLLYPPDPTEQNAFIGASVATNAIWGPHLQIWRYPTVGKTNKGCSFYGGHSGTASWRIRCR